MFRTSAIQRIVPSSSRAVSTVPITPASHQVQSKPRAKTLKEARTNSSADPLVSRVLQNAQSRTPFSLKNPASEEMSLEGMSPMAKRLLLLRQKAGKSSDSDANEIAAMETSTIETLRPLKISLRAQDQRAAQNTGTSYYPKGATMRTSSPRISNNPRTPRSTPTVDTSGAFASSPNKSQNKAGPNPKPRTLSPRKKLSKSQSPISNQPILVNPTKFTPFAPLNLATLMKVNKVIGMKRNLQKQRESQGDYSRFIDPAPLNPPTSIGSQVEVIARLRHGLMTSGVGLKEREFFVGKVQDLMSIGAR